MLFLATSATDFLGATVSLWLAAYILVRGFSSRITLRAVVVLLSLSAFFFSGYLHLQRPTPGSTAWRAVFLTLGLVAWFDLTLRLLPSAAQRKTRWVARGLYAGSLAAIALLIGQQNMFVDPGNPLLVTQVKVGAGYIVYGLLLIALAAATIYNFRMWTRSGAGPHFRHFLVATVVAAGGAIVTYVAAALPGLPPMPRVARDFLLFVAVPLLGYSVARHQAFVERRTTLQDLPIAGLAVLGLSGVYALAAWRSGFSAEGLAYITLLAILTHSTYDVVRGFLDRLLYRRESALRRQLRELARDVGGESTFASNLQQALAIMCTTLRAPGGFMAVREADQFSVAASLDSLDVGAKLEAEGVRCEDICQPQLTGALAGKTAWLAPAFVDSDQVGVIGLGPRASGGKYSEADLDLLAEIADWMGHLVRAHARQRDSRERLVQLASEVQSREVGLQAEAEDLLTTLESDPDREFVRLVEEGLRNLSDYAALGQSPLAAQLGAPGATHVERGKSLRQMLIEAIEALRPAGQRPAGILPREWHSHAILRDAYVEDAPNREIMARLYISEGTFNRVRRKALRAVARSLWETKTNSPAPADARQPVTTAVEIE
jgi:hypothetical protein